MDKIRLVLVLLVAVVISGKEVREEQTNKNVYLWIPETQRNITIPYGAINALEILAVLASEGIPKPDITKDKKLEAVAKAMPALQSAIAKNSTRAAREAAPDMLTALADLMDKPGYVLALSFDHGVPTWQYGRTSLVVNPQHEWAARVGTWGAIPTYNTRGLDIDIAYTTLSYELIAAIPEEISAVDTLATPPPGKKYLLRMPVEDRTIWHKNPSQQSCNARKMLELSLDKFMASQRPGWTLLVPAYFACAQQGELDVASFALVENETILTHALTATCHFPDELTAKNAPAFFKTALLRNSIRWRNVIGEGKGSTTAAVADEELKPDF